MILGWSQVWNLCHQYRLISGTSGEPRDVRISSPCLSGHSLSSTLKLKSSARLSPVDELTKQEEFGQEHSGQVCSACVTTVTKNNVLGEETRMRLDPEDSVSLSAYSASMSDTALRVGCLCIEFTQVGSQCEVGLHSDVGQDRRMVRSL